MNASPSLDGGRRVLQGPAGTQAPVLSVVTVTLNAIAGLRATADSVARQDWSGIEHIVIDGGSTDGSVEFLKDRGASIEYWRSRHDKGIYDAMNAGLALARGRHVLFLNSGDLLVGRPLRSDSDLSALLAVRKTGFRGKPVFARLRNHKLCMPYCHQGIVFRNDGLVPFDTSFRIAADYLFLLDNLDKAGMAAPRIPGDGHVVFDASGVSSKQVFRRDRETARIILDRFGRGFWLLFWLRQLPKLMAYRLKAALVRS